MTFITAIELENFQSIEARTRIELRPITLLYGPNSAGKSAVFDAIELLRALLDPTAIDEARAASMVDRWARRREGPWREMFLAVEFPFEFIDTFQVWEDAANWFGRNKQAQYCSFLLEPDFVEANGVPLNGQQVRIELRIGIRETHRETICHLVESSCRVGPNPVLNLTVQSPVVRKSPDLREPDLEVADEPDEEEEVPENELDPWPYFDGERWLEIFEETGFLDTSVIVELGEKKSDDWHETPSLQRAGSFCHVNCQVNVALSPMRLSASDLRTTTRGIRESISKNAEDIFFYFGTMLWDGMRAKAPVVRADRRSPRPDEAMTVVDLGLKGWWAKSAMAPSSPAALLQSRSHEIDEHFKGLAEAAHAALLMKASGHYLWGDDHAREHIEPVRAKAEFLERVNHHLERGLFSEKLYRLECASTLLVPIDLEEEDPWTYYALAQPAAVRLYLREAGGQKVDLQDVGSGVSYVLPVLYALSRQGLVQVQQPELHLHPALQASVGDIFIEELHRPGFGQLLIETHSEHILLRLLRRIRDTEKGRVLSDDVKLNNEQLAVYYFDPRPDGGTFVSRQLVTPLGDFYNDWPRGFFAERNKDLFDEE